MLEGEGPCGQRLQGIERDLQRDTDLVAHLVQDRGVIERLQADEIPPDAYYDELDPVLRAMFPNADPCPTTRCSLPPPSMWQLSSL